MKLLQTDLILLPGKIKKQNKLVTESNVYTGKTR